MVATCRPSLRAGSCVPANRPPDQGSLCRAMRSPRPMHRQHAEPSQSQSDSYQCGLAYTLPFWNCLSKKSHATALARPVPRIGLAGIYGLCTGADHHCQAWYSWRPSVFASTRSSGSGPGRELTRCPDLFVLAVMSTCFPFFAHSNHDRGAAFEPCGSGG